MDCVCCLSILLHFVSFLYFNDKAFIRQQGAVELDAILVVVNCLVFIAILFLFIWTLLEHYFRHYTTAVLSKHVGDLVVKIQAELTQRRSVLTQHLEASSAGNVKFHQFLFAAQTCLQGSSQKISAQSLEVTFLILRYVSFDVPNTTELAADKLREPEVPLEVVRSFPSGCFLLACMSCKHARKRRTLLGWASGTLNVPCHVRCESAACNVQDAMCKMPRVSVNHTQP